ncbi:hypothetical protein OIU84_010567, partial [Salix udensis]
MEAPAAIAKTPRGVFPIMKWIKSAMMNTRREWSFSALPCEGTTQFPNVSCNYSQDPHKDSCSSRKTVDQLAKFAVVTLAAGVLTVGSVGDASAAKSGGRVGGQAFRSSAPRSAPRINNNS